MALYFVKDFTVHGILEISVRPIGLSHIVHDFYRCCSVETRRSLVGKCVGLLDVKPRENNKNNDNALKVKGHN